MRGSTRTAFAGWVGAVLWAVGGTATPAGAQILPDAPRMLGPYTSSGLGVHWLRAGALPDDGDAVLVTWSPESTTRRVRLRGGAGRGAGGTVAGLGGIDVVAPLGTNPSSPVRLAWTAGAGVSVGEWALVTIPAGISAGFAWQSGSVWLAPWVAAGAALDLRLGEEAPGDEFDAGVAAEVGVELSLERSRRVLVRAAASLGDRQAVAVGLVVHTGPG